MPLYYTRTGDKGKTGLFGTANRVTKADARIELIGQLDELQAFVGLARSAAKNDKLDSIESVLAEVQSGIFYLSTDIASGPKAKSNISESHVKKLEKEIDAVAPELKPLRNFIFPAGSRAACLLHVCRTVARRAERRAVALSTKERLNPHALEYINRLSSLMFVLARLANRLQKVAEDEWKP